MTLEEVESLLLDTYELCRNVSTSEDAMAKAERAVAFHRKLAEQGILRLTSEMEEMLAWCESVLSIARDARAIGFPFKKAQERYVTSRAKVRTPLDVLGIILDHVGEDRTTLESFAMCNRTFYSLAQPRLLNHVFLDTLPELIRFAYTLELQPKDSRLPLLVKSLVLGWSSYGLRPDKPDDEARISKNRLMHMILARCSMVTALEFQGDETDILQSNFNALDGFLRLTPKVESLSFYFWRRANDRASFDSQDSQEFSIIQATKPDIILQKGTTDRLRRLRSFYLHTYTGIGWAWPVCIPCLGPALRCIELECETPKPGQLLQIANSSPNLAEVILGCTTRDTWADLSQFIKLVGPSLTRFELKSARAPASETGTFSELLEFLTLHAKGLEVLKIISEPNVSKDDLRMLARPASLPRLRKLTLLDIDHKTAKDERNACGDALAAVLESHKTTLEDVYIHGHSLLAGDAFAEACLRLQRPCRIGSVDFAPNTSLESLERLYHSRFQLHPSLLQHALIRLRADTACSACFWVVGAIDISHSVQQCPKAVGINLKEAEWPEAELHGYCPQCLVPRRDCVQLYPQDCRWEPVTRPLIEFLAARDPFWNTVGENGEPAYWKPVLRSLLRMEIHGHPGPFR